MEIDDERLEAIRQRAEAASPGPWLTLDEILANPAKPGDPWYTTMGGSKYAPTYDGRRPVDHEGCDVWPWGCREDMVFAYKARDDVPYLLAVIDELRH